MQASAHLPFAARQMLLPLTMYFPVRKRVRDPNQNYAGPGAWFITINTVFAECLFGAVVEGQMRLNEIGAIVHRHWEAIPAHFPHARVDSFVVMPNHVHGILWLTSCDPRLTSAEDFHPRFGHPVRGALGTIVGAFKATVTRDVRQLLGDRVTLWQDGFHDRRLRYKQSVDRTRRYVAQNPARWSQDYHSRRGLPRVLCLPARHEPP